MVLKDILAGYRKKLQTCCSYLIFALLLAAKTFPLAPSLHLVDNSTSRFIAGQLKNPTRKEKILKDDITKTNIKNISHLCDKALFTIGLCILTGPWLTRWKPAEAAAGKLPCWAECRPSSWLSSEVFRSIAVRPLRILIRNKKKKMNMSSTMKLPTATETFMGSSWDLPAKNREIDYFFFVGVDLTDRSYWKQPWRGMMEAWSHWWATMTLMNVLHPLYSWTTLYMVVPPTVPADNPFKNHLLGNAWNAKVGKCFLLFD